MAETVYVLMSQEGSGKNRAWRPVAAVRNPDIATQWMQHGSGVDWVPLEMDDVSNLTPGDRPQTFQPRETTSGEQRAIELKAEIDATIQRMQKIIDSQQKTLDDQQKLIKKLMGAKQGSEAEVTLAAEEDKIPPRPVEKTKSGMQPFSPTLDAQGLADYIETYAVYPVDNEFVYEMFKGSHAVLKMVPIADLSEGERNKNLNSKKIEDKYLKQDLKTQPPAVVENGEVLDGNHRFRANKRRGLTSMWCYVVSNGEAPDGNDDSNGGIKT